MNGLFIQLPFYNWKMENVNNNQVKYLYFPNNNVNQEIVRKILDLEAFIVDLYKKKHDCTKKNSNLLKYQLSSGSLKIQKKYYSLNEEINVSPIEKKQYIIKLSGVWESNEEVGLTFKILETIQG